MNSFQKLFFGAAFLFVVFACSAAKTHAQNLNFQYFYRLEMAGAHEPPRFPNGFPDFMFPDEVRKKGIEGTLKISLTLGEDSKIKDVKVIESLSKTVDEMVTKNLQTLRFIPAQTNGKPISTTMFFDYTIAATYGESDDNVSKPKITSQPAAVYPEKYRAEKLKGKVAVSVMFYPDGNFKVIGASSVLPKEFDRAATAAAQNLKFTPAVHKKSKKPVAQQMIVQYDFKP